MALVLGVALTASSTVAGGRVSGGTLANKFVQPINISCLREASDVVAVRVISVTPVGGRGAIRYRLPGPERSAPVGATSDRPRALVAARTATVTGLQLQPQPYLCQIQ
jgi:hypothetical protein